MPIWFQKNAVRPIDGHRCASALPSPRHKARHDADHAGICVGRGASLWSAVCSGPRSYPPPAAPSLTKGSSSDHRSNNKITGYRLTGRVTDGQGYRFSRSFVYATHCWTFRTVTLQNARNRTGRKCTLTLQMKVRL